MTLISRVFADQIREDPRNPPNPREVLFDILAVVLHTAKQSPKIKFYPPRALQIWVLCSHVSRLTTL